MFIHLSVSIISTSHFLVEFVLFNSLAYNYNRHSLHINIYPVEHYCVNVQTKDISTCSFGMFANLSSLWIASFPPPLIVHKSCSVFLTKTQIENLYCCLHSSGFFFLPLSAFCLYAGPLKYK